MSQRCSALNEHFRQHYYMREDGWRCGKGEGHDNGHYLYSDDGERVLDQMGPWTVQEPGNANE